RSAGGAEGDPPVCHSASQYENESPRERADPSLSISVLEQELPRFGIIPSVRKLPAEGVGKAIVDVEQERDVERVRDRLTRHTALQHRPNRGCVERLRGKRE